MRYNSFISNIEYFPAIGIFSLAIQSDQWILEAAENYQKKGFRNKCKIIGSQGTTILSIPLEQGKNNGLFIRDVKISYDLNWQKQHWQTIKTNYGSSPYFIHYEHEFIKFYTSRYNFLFDCCLASIELVSKLIHFKSKIIFSENFIQNYSSHNIIDFRANFTNPEPSDLEFYKYEQVFQDRLGFVPNLSILDLVFCSGPESKKILEKTKILYL